MCLDQGSIPCSSTKKTSLFRGLFFMSVILNKNESSLDILKDVFEIYSLLTFMVGTNTFLNE